MHDGGSVTDASYFPVGIPCPQPTIDDAEFWAGCARRELLVQTCSSCGQRRLPPTPICPRCRCEELGWERVPGTGSVFTFTWVHLVVEPGLELMATPYNVAVVQLDDGHGVRILSNIVDADEFSLAIGDRVEVVWDERSAVTVPRFRLVRR